MSVVGRLLPLQLPPNNRGDAETQRHAERISNRLSLRHLRASAPLRLSGGSGRSGCSKSAQDGHAPAAPASGGAQASVVE